MFMKRKELNSSERLKLKADAPAPKTVPDASFQECSGSCLHGPFRHLLEARRDELGTRPLLSQSVGNNPDGTKPLIANSA